MNWNGILVVGAVVVAVFLLKRMSFVPAGVARRYLQQGALVVDVRSAGEFDSGHLPNAINIPLDEMESALPRRVKDKNQVLLLHCLSGVRSGMAGSKLKRLGYANVFNLGSFARARKIAVGNLRADDDTV